MTNNSTGAASSKGKPDSSGDRRRMNIAVSATGYDYIATMARVEGVSMTRYIADLIDREAEANSDLYDRAQQLFHRKSD